MKSSLAASTDPVAFVRSCSYLEGTTVRCQFSVEDYVEERRKQNH